MNVTDASREQLCQWKQELDSAYQQFKQQNLKLDLTRGKPSTTQLDLSDKLDGILDGNYTTIGGADTRNYGGLYGIPELRDLGAELLGVSTSEIMVGGNSSLSYMYYSIMFAKLFGLGGAPSWDSEGPSKFICPVPGYDRHFAICEALGIEMINVPMLADGPDMDAVEALIADDSSIKGMWNVPKYSNPTGLTYSDKTVERIARLGKTAPANFRVFWDNAYAVHDLSDSPDQLASIMDYCRNHGTEDLVIQFTSTSKITFAGAGVCFVGASESNLSSLAKHLGIAMIGPDKVNQLRHTRLFPDIEALRTHMQCHRAVLAPRFETVEKHLREHFENSDLATWNKPEGGYFVSFDTLPGLASEVVGLCSEAGVALTPAGATFPYGKDPNNSNIRLAPSFPSLEEIEQIMEVFCCCVKLASVRQALS